jgi:hypothetical protein
MKRLQHEGHSFVTVVLPRFAKHILLCLEQGFWIDFDTSIRKRRGLPIIFSGYLKQLFSFTKNGYVVAPQPCPVALFAIRQACEYLYKLSIPYTQERLHDASKGFIENESTVFKREDLDLRFVKKMRANFLRHYPTSANLCLEDFVSKAKSGPGTFVGSTSNYWVRKFESHQIIPELKHFKHMFRLNKNWNPASVCDSEEDYAEVLFVPKDSRGPRVISREPFNKLKFSMGFFYSLSKALEHDTRHRINFRSQEINQNLARESSIDGRFATMDLKDASDRVSFALVRELFQGLPHSSYIQKVRSKYAMLNGKKITLNKLAGMGSGLTFVTLALVIHLAIVTYICDVKKISRYKDIAKLVYVYGDDIIVPSWMFTLAAEAVEKIGLKTNKSKSFFRGSFRESCGGDYLNGNSVSPVRLKLSSSGCDFGNIRGVAPSNDKIPNLVEELTAHYKELVKAQLFKTAELIGDVLEKKLGPLPFVSDSSSIIGKYTPDASKIIIERHPDSTPKKKRFWVVQPLKADITPFACPGRYLMTQLSKVASPWLLNIEQAAAFGITSIPKMQCLRRRRLVTSDLNLD